MLSSATTRLDPSTTHPQRQHDITAIRMTPSSLLDPNSFLDPRPAPAPPNRPSVHHRRAPLNHPEQHGTTLVDPSSLSDGDGQQNELRPPPPLRDPATHRRNTYTRTEVPSSRQRIPPDSRPGHRHHYRFVNVPALATVDDPDAITPAPPVPPLNPHQPLLNSRWSATPPASIAAPSEPPERLHAPDGVRVRQGKLVKRRRPSSPTVDVRHNYTGKEIEDVDHIYKTGTPRRNMYLIGSCMLWALWLVLFCTFLLGGAVSSTNPIV